MYTNSSSSSSSNYGYQYEYEYEYDYNDGDGDGDSRFFARALGYSVGLGSLMLYIPIIIRLLRQKHAGGLVMSTWWLKVCDFTISDVYYVRNHYELSTYLEQIILTIETLIVLFLVAMYQQKTKTTFFWVCLSVFLIGTSYGFTIAPEALVATGKVWTVLIYGIAILPQFWHNYSTKTKGDYSPVTAGLTIVGCLVRIFTVITLNGSDPILLFGFISSTLINSALLWQIVYYGVLVEGLTLWQVLLSDIVTANNNNDNDHGSEEEAESVGTGGAYANGGLYDGNDESSGENNPQEPEQQEHHQGGVLQQQDCSDRAPFRRERSNTELSEEQSPPSSTDTAIAGTTVDPNHSSDSDSDSDSDSVGLV